MAALRKSLRALDLRHLALVGAVLFAFVALSVAVIPSMKADGDVRVVSNDFIPGQTIPGLRTGGKIQRGQFGYVVPGQSRARASFSVAASAPRQGEKVVLVVTAGGLAGAVTSLSMVEPNGARHHIGDPQRWQQHKVDVTEAMVAGATRIVFETDNHTDIGQLMVLQVRAITYPPKAIPRASRLEVALWVVLATVL